MAHHVVILLMRRIEQLLEPNEYFPLVPSFQEILEFAYGEVKSLERIAERIFWSSTSSLDLEIRATVPKLGDVVEQILSQRRLYNRDGVLSPIVLQGLKQEIHFITKTLKEYIKELDNPLPNKEEEEEEEVVSSRIDFGGNKSKMVGLSDKYKELKRCLMHRGSVFGPGVVSILGMPGIGKTTLANEIFEDPEIKKHFDCRVWVKVGKKCHLKEIPRRILAELNPDQMLVEGDEDTVHRYFKESLKDKRYLIVLDDVWNKYMAHNLNSSILSGRKEFKLPFPDEQNGSQVLLTTRLQQVDEDNYEFPCEIIKMRLLNKEESWDLLREKVFDKELCSPQLEKAGKKIADKCDGLPLTIVAVADLLSKSEKSPQHWSEVAEKKNHQLFIDAYDEISKVLLRSYKYLPHLLQMCFLYMGVFPQNYEIPRSKLIDMWNADGFLELNVHKFPPPSAMQCLEELISNSLVMILQCTTFSASFMEGKKKVKTCNLHSSLWHLSNREAKKSKFSHVLNSLNDGLGDAMKNQCRLSFHNNILFGIKDVYKLVKDNCASTLCSLFCYGPYHQYQVPICFDLELLRVLDSLTICFYEFPTEVLQLVELRYLSLSLNKKIPVSICQLSNLQFLIVNRHMSIKSCVGPSYLPVEIWNMKKLQHLQVMGCDLPKPPGSASLESLLTLSNVSSHSCTKGVLEALPNLRKLGVQIELAPDDDGKTLSCFDHISHLALESLKCVIVNPEIVTAIAPFSSSPSYLGKLSLSGMGYPWKEASKIALLKSLRVLKLRNYAFQGPEWEVEEEGFPKLTSLVIDDIDLVEWKIGRGSFKNLWYLRIQHCYKLEKIHCESNLFHARVKLVDCNPLGVREIEKSLSWDVDVSCSWKDGKLKTWVKT